MHNSHITVITCTYGPDYERAERLCQSVDKFVPETVAHCLIVPRRDLARFETLAGGRRYLASVEEVLPGRYRQLPFGQRWWLGPAPWPIRGWIMQQITKLSANAVTNSEVLLFADSDVTFIRPFDEARFCRDGEVRLHRVPGAGQDRDHLRWHQRAAKLLRKRSDYFGSDYIGQLITWRRSNLEKLHEHLESLHRKPWHWTVARSLHFSEYILYGAFVEHVMSAHESRHFNCENDVCHCCWYEDDLHRLIDRQTAVSTDAQAILLQSNMGMEASNEAQFFEQLTSDINVAAQESAS